MHSDNHAIAIGLSQPFACSYLSGQQEQLLVIQEDELDLSLFERLLALGFRRSGSAIYKPRCPHCNACQPIRVPLDEFRLSKRQKRTLAKNRDLHFRIVTKEALAHYPLYERYICARHSDGPMYPPSEEQYRHFLACEWLSPVFIELWHGQRLVAVAVTDLLPQSLSAIYSYFDPDYSERSLGSLLVLLQCRLGKLMSKSFLYLGYQIDNHDKMGYKRLYRPYEILGVQGWQKSDNH